MVGWYLSRLSVLTAFTAMDYRYGLFLLIVTISFISAHQINGLGRYAECGSGKVNYPILPGNIGGTGRAKRQAPQPIRISPYFVTSTISAGLLTRLQASDGPVMNALSYFRRTLSVEPFGENIRAPSTGTCGPHAVIPQAHGPSGAGVDADYLYYITAVNDVSCQSGLAAYAGPCYVAPAMDNRPYIGYVNFCPDAFDQFSNEFFNVLSIHEAMHALVFLPFLFERFPDHNNALQRQRILRRNTYTLTTPKVVQAARDYYNCPTLKGALLENEGAEATQGTHWESRVFFPEVMNGIIYDQLASITVISRQTLSVFEDSGWYTVDYDAGLSQEKLLWGANEGCGFLTVNCNSTSYPYSCTPCCDSSLQCAYDYQSAGYCTKPSLFDFCPVVLPGQPCTNTVGPQSICVENSDQDSSVIANCVVHRCVQVEGSDLMAFTLTINGQTEWCYPGGTVNNGLQQCPPVKYACARGIVDMLSVGSSLPPPLCDPSCASCSAAHNPAFCLTCPTGRRLNGNASTSCVSDDNPCNGSTYLNPGGSCSTCPSGCSLCNGTMNSECFACEDTTRYRDTTNVQVFSGPCVTSCGSSMVANEDVFGVRTCTQRATAGGGADVLGGVSTIYWTMIMMMFSIVTTVQL